ncbi:MAG: type II toxin-antitoxin system prevent-host-death family antitoxin [Verrucomicrobiota bacterium]
MKVKEVGAFEAKTHLSQLLNEVEAGEVIYITRHGKRVAELKSPETKPKNSRHFGCAKGEPFYMAPDFDKPLDEFKEYMP